jgi:4-aminobutyrate aminotransferase-like enzyme
MAKILETSSSVDGYDPRKENSRVMLPDVLVHGRRLNRGTATVKVREPVDPPEDQAARKAWHESVWPTTLPDDAPVVHLDWPTHGPFVLAPHGVYFDAYLGVAQKLLDERHPRFKRMLNDLEDEGVLLRREIVTDDYVAVDPESQLRTPRDLARLWATAVGKRWPQPEGYEAFFSSSGAESVEAALKICYETAYKRFLEKHGIETFRRVQEELGIATVPYFDRDPALAEHPVYEDYPFMIVACEGAFHGRTLGALSLTWSKRAHRLAYPRAWNVLHVPYNAEEDVLREIVDWRSLEEILTRPGELRRVVREQGRAPKDLLAGFVAEPFQGEGGYVPGNPGFFARARAVCDEADALLVVDEVQSIGRTGRLFMTEHLGVRPDVITAAKSMVIGVTVARADLARYCHLGWHSNTWGAGRTLDTNFAWTTLDTLLHHKDPIFDGLGYLENEQVKGRLLAEGLDHLASRHPRFVAGHRGYGLMRALLVRERPRVIQTAWKQGLKLLGCGLGGEVASIRLILLADTLAREVDELVGVLDRTFRVLEKS